MYILSTRNYFVIPVHIVVSLLVDLLLRGRYDFEYGGVAPHVADDSLDDLAYEVPRVGETEDVVDDIVDAAAARLRCRP